MLQGRGKNSVLKSDVRQCALLRGRALNPRHEAYETPVLPTELPRNTAHIAVAVRPFLFLGGSVLSGVMSLAAGLQSTCFELFAELVEWYTVRVSSPSALGESQLTTTCCLTVCCICSNFLWVRHESNVCALLGTAFTVRRYRPLTHRPTKSSKQSNLKRWSGLRASNPPASAWKALCSQRPPAQKIDQCSKPLALRPTLERAKQSPVPVAGSERCCQLCLS